MKIVMQGSSETKAAVRLDWSRLLGFDQATRDAHQADANGMTGARLMRLGAKTGGKIGGKTCQTVVK